MFHELLGLWEEFLYILYREFKNLISTYVILLRQRKNIIQLQKFTPESCGIAHKVNKIRNDLELNTPFRCRIDYVNCKPCFHRDRRLIDQQLIVGQPMRAISAAFGLSLGSLHRHKSHVKVELASAIQARANDGLERAGDLLQRVEVLLEEAGAVLASAKSTENWKGAVASIVACTRLIELLARLRGELRSGDAGIHVNFTSNKVTINTHDDDRQIALLVSEATEGFSPAAIERLRALAEGRQAGIETRL